MRRALLLLGLLAPGLLAQGAAAQAPADPLAPFGWLRQLAGSCWRGEYGNTRTADKQCYAWQYGRVLRGTIELTGTQADGAALDLRGDSVWAWDAQRNRIQLTTWASNGTLTPGEAVFDGELLRVTMGRAEAAPPALRTTWQRLDADAFMVRRERREGETWREILVVRYVRTP